MSITSTQPSSLTVIRRHGRPGPASDAVPGAAPGGAAAPETAPDAVRALLARWRRDGTTFVVVDERGRHRDRLAAGRIDLTRAAVTDARWIEAALHRNGFALLDARNVPRAGRPQAIRHALAAMHRLRARTGGPVWILVEDAQDVLREPGIPPHAWRLDDGGHCLVARDGGSLPAWTAAGSAPRVRLPGLDLDLTLIPRPQHGATDSGR